MFLLLIIYFIIDYYRWCDRVNEINRRKAWHNQHAEERNHADLVQRMHRGDSSAVAERLLNTAHIGYGKNKKTSLEYYEGQVNE